MDPSNKTVSKLVGLVKSWLPFQSEPDNVSRDFWMPDHSCPVCYECDSQFTLFNRRHHCRLCGRVFCGKCTTNSVPAPSNDPRIPKEERDKIRVCNFCFKQWENATTTATIDDGAQVWNQELSISPSANSFFSTISCGTACSSFTLSSLTYPAGPYPQFQPRSILISHQLPPRSKRIDRPGKIAPKRSNDLTTDAEDITSNQYEFPFPRSDDDDDVVSLYSLYTFDSEARLFSQESIYFTPFESEDMSNGDGSHKFHPDKENIDLKSLSSSPPVTDTFASRGLEGIPQLDKKDEHEVDDDKEAVAPIDFEDNKLLWFPPEPEDEEDDKEAALFDSDEECDVTGELGHLRKSSFGSGNSRFKDKSSEGKKKDVKNVVDGHFRALVSQLLLVENLPVGDENDKESWLEIITALSWEAATLLKPDRGQGGGMDPGGYVKVKCIASGRRCESMIVKGVVCKKNVAHRRMASKMEKPKLLILGGALEYQRVSNQFSSFDTLLQQEMDYLKMAVAKINAHQPSILLVEKSVSRFVQDNLLERNISLVLNIKRSLLERIARCTGAEVIPSIDHISSQKMGSCEKFHVERLVEDLGSAGQGGKNMSKTLMYFEGCPKPLGCTILLRGANGDELKKVKHVVQYGIFAAYHLALETSFLADEGASLPELPLNTPITVALLDKPSSTARSISTVPGFITPPSPLPNGASFLSGRPPRSNSGKVILNAFSMRNYMDPKESSMMEAFAEESEPAFLNNDFTFSSVVLLESSGQYLMAHIDQENHSTAVEIQPGDSESASVPQNSNYLSNLPEEPKSLKEEFPSSPKDNQSILVSLSSRCVWKGTICERSHLFRIKYYGSFDKPLGRFLRDDLLDQSYRCHSCDLPSEAHIHCYSHQQGTLTISVKKLPEILLPGERLGNIWMWHRCMRCPRDNGLPPTTQRIVMSDAAWGLSFGKFLELSFSNHAAASRVASCGHSLHRDCLRFYGFGRMVACFRYATIDVHSVFLPPLKVSFDFENQEWIRKETDKVAYRAEHMFSEVLNSLGKIREKLIATSGSPHSITETPELRHQVADLEGILLREKMEFQESLQKALKSEERRGKHVIDILEVNRLRRQLLFQSYMWDHRLVFASNLENYNLQDSYSNLISGHEDKSVTDDEKLKDIDILELGKGNECTDFALADAKLDRGSYKRESNGNINHSEVIHEEQDMSENSNPVTEEYGILSDSQSMHDRVDGEKPMANVRRALSEGQFPVIEDLSDTLDAAWTGKIQRTAVLPKQISCFLSDTAPLDIAAVDAVTEGSDLDVRSEEKIGLKVSHSPSPALSSKGSENLEDVVSWLKMPFLSFYRSLNKNLLGNASKLDTFSEYDPIYVSSFRELEMQDGVRLLLPVGVNDTVIPVYDDEPTSMISYALASPEYHFQVSDDGDRPKESGDLTASVLLPDSVIQSSFSLDEMTFDHHMSLASTASTDSITGSRTSNMDPLSSTKSLHVRVSFGDDGSYDKVKFTVTCYYAKRFEALRRMCCPSELDFIRSLSRCKKWIAQGGKSNVFFAKTLDDRFIIKQVTKTELESFIKFAPGYFKYLSESISSRSPTLLAKILGIYQVTEKHLKGGKETKMDVLVMENLLFGRNVTRQYDLKGSRSRYVPDSGGSNKVLLDQNLIELMRTSPIFVSNKAKRLLERAIWNDTAFLAASDVMDYSLLVGVDEEKHELVVGIIDFMRQYTWDKHLETWVKASGILGGPKNASPTVISPKQYKKRFRKAMGTYFLMIPDQWSPPTESGRSQSDIGE